MFQDKPSQRLAYLVKKHNRNPIVLRHTYLSNQGASPSSLFLVIGRPLRLRISLPLCALSSNSRKIC
jgi:hypothetical protein